MLIFRLGFYIPLIVLTAIAVIMTLVLFANSQKPLFILIVIFIPFLCICSLYTISTSLIHSSGFAIPGTNGIQNVQNIDIANLNISTSVEFPVIKGQSISIETAIFTQQMTESSGTVVQYSAKPIPIGTPGVPIRDVFGTGYTVSARAQLSASAFNIDPHESQEQSFDQNNPVIFPWTATPLFSGKQDLEVVITGVWTPKGGGVAIERPLARQSFSLDVAESSSSFISLGQLDLGTLLGVFFGSALNVPWVIELVKKMRERRQRRRQPSHIPSPARKKRRQRKK